MRSTRPSLGPCEKRGGERGREGERIHDENMARVGGSVSVRVRDESWCERGERRRGLDLEEAVVYTKKGHQISMGKRTIENQPREGQRVVPLPR